MQAATTANLWRRRLGHLNRKSLDLLKHLDNNGVSSTGPRQTATRVPWETVTSWLICSSQSQAPFPAGFGRSDGKVDARGTRGLQARDQYLRRVHQVDGELPAEVQARRSWLVSHVRTICDSSGFQVKRLRADKAGDFTEQEFQNCCLRTGVSLELASTNAPQQIGMSTRVEITLVAMLRCMVADGELPKLL